jgi:ATP-dependent Zn protease
MTGLMRTRAFVTMLTCALALAIAAAAVPAIASAASESQESQQVGEQQLASGQIVSATINKRLRRVHVVLKDGTKVYYRYQPKEEPKVLADLQKKHVAVTVLTPTAAKKEASTGKTKHKIRYIVGGALIVIVLIVGGVLLVNRRRQRLAE